jgi:hypothetical protein
MQRSLFCLVGFLLAFADLANTQQQASQPVKPDTAVLAASNPAPVPNTLLDGTPVKLRLSETISSAEAKVGQQVPFEVIDEIDVDGRPVIAKGATALASVTAAEPKKRMGRGGKLDVNIDSVRLVDNEKATLRAVKDTKGGGHTGAMTGAMVATGIVFFPAAPLFLFMHGKDITIPKGTEITAFVQGDMKLDMSKFDNPESVSAPVAIQATVVVEANVPNCDIDVDGNFVGNTPSTLNLAPGKHEISIKKTGYQIWTRNMMVNAGSVHLSADLEAAK